MPVRLITNRAELTEIRSAWDVLFRSNPAHTPFQSWEWNYAWWSHFGTDGDLRVLLVSDQTRPIGIAPLVLCPSYRGLPLRHLTLLSSKRADYLDFLVSPGCERPFFVALFSYLREYPEGWHLLDLRDIPEDSGNLPYLLSAGSDQLPFVDRRTGEACATVPLPPTWQDYLSGLGKNARRNAGRYTRQLEKRFRVEWRACCTAADIRRYYPDFIEVFRQRWQPEQGRTFFDDPRAAAFEADVCRLASEAGWYRLYLLYADNQPVAGYLGYVCNNKFYAGLLAHSPAMNGHSVGTVLIGLTIQHCIAQGWSELDMTRGDEPYKAQWNCRVKNNCRIKLSRTATALGYAIAIDAVRERLQGIRLLHRIRAAYRARTLHNPEGAGPLPSADTDRAVSRKRPAADPP